MSTSLQKLSSSAAPDAPPDVALHTGPLWSAVALRLLLVAAVCLLAGWSGYSLYLARQLDQLALQARQHLDFYRTSLESLLTRNESLPRIIALEDRLRASLRDPSGLRLDWANAYLLEVKKRAGLNAVFLMNRDGLTVAASNYLTAGSYVGHNYRFRPYFQAAMDGNLGLFYGIGATTGEPGYFLAAPVGDGMRDTAGVITVKISLEDFEAALVRSGDPVLLVDAHGVVFLASVSELKYRHLAPLAAGAAGQIAASRQYGERPLQALDMKLPLDGEVAYLPITLPGREKGKYLVQSVRTGDLGWSLVLLSQTRQERQSALLAGAAASLGVACVLSLAFFLKLNTRRYKERRQAEAALRQAHASLERRIGERTSELLQTNASLQEKVAALKSAETILCETRDAAVQAGKLAVLGQMAAGISHEVNQPLTALHTFADNAVDLLERGELGEVRENLGLIRQMAVRMGHIVGEIKNFARRPSEEKSAVSVAAVVDQALMLVEAQRKRAEADVDTGGVDETVQVWADPQRLEQVTVNLLLNAVDAVAAAAERRVWIAARRDGDRVLLIVRDSGAGIAPEVEPRLFEPFFTTKAAGRGLGLGLPISRMILSELGGDLSARNHPGGGAEFTVTLEAV